VNLVDDKIEFDVQQKITATVGEDGIIKASTDSQ